MFYSILDVLFLIQLFKKSIYQAPKFIGSHYGQDNLSKLRRLGVYGALFVYPTLCNVFLHF